MTGDQRSFAVLMTHFKAEEKRLNPFYRATQVTTLISKMRRETSSALSLGDTTVKDSLDAIPLTAGKKRLPSRGFSVNMRQPGLPGPLAPGGAPWTRQARTTVSGR